MVFSKSLLLYCLLSPARAAVHNMFVGNLFTPALIHALEFDDETNKLEIVQTIQSEAPYAWIAFDVCPPTHVLL
jgi:hypothetical protein